MKLHRWINIMTFLSLLFTNGGLLLFWNRIPEKVPGHYDGNGEITRMGDKNEILLLVILMTVFVMMLFLIDYAICLTNGSVINTVVKGYYKKEKDSDRIYLKYWSRLMIELVNLEMVLIFAAIIYSMALNSELGPFFTPGVFLVLFGSIGVCCFKIFRRFFQVCRRGQE